MTNQEKAERALVARTRDVFTRLVGLEAGDKLADDLWEARLARLRERQQ
jgi:hypothetical protein